MSPPKQSWVLNRSAEGGSAILMSFHISLTVFQFLHSASLGSCCITAAKHHRFFCAGHHIGGGGCVTP